MHKPMALLVLAPVALCVGAVLAQQVPSDTVRNPLAADPQAAALGQQVYNGTCQTCHGASGQGDRAPALTSATFAHGNEDADLFHTIRAGVPGTQMPPFARLSDTQVWQLVAYIRSIQGMTPAAGASGGSAPAITGNAAAGDALFFGKAACSSCHAIDGRGGLTGPDLSAAGRLPAEAIRSKIVDPTGANPVAPGRGRGGPPPVTLVVKTADGRTIRGVRRNEDTFSAQIVDASGELHLIDKLKTPVTVEYHSLMPADYATRLTPDELNDLVAFLSGHKARDLSKTAAVQLGGGVGYERLLKAEAEPQNWLMYWGNYRGTHFSPLAQITPANTARLRPEWTFPIASDAALEGTPLVVDGIVYVTSGGHPLNVLALDAKTGRQIWHYTRPQKVTSPYEINPFNRGVAILGNRLFVGTLDAAVVALDARSGLPLWEVQVADTMLGHNITSPPLALKDRIIVGVSGGEFATRGFLDAYDAATGKRLWRIFTIPGPGEPGNETWKGESWKTGGAPTWLTGTYDAELDTVYWPIGNPEPQYDPAARGLLDNLYSNCVLALDPGTGKMKWYFQFTPNDGRDWDSVQDMVLVDRVWHGQPRKLLLHADRNGHFYVLDRTNGSFLQGTPFAYQNWNTGFDPHGRPIPAPRTNASAEGSILVYPSPGGATNFQSPSYSPVTGLFYLAYAESSAQYISRTQEIEAGRQYLGRAPARPGGPPARGPNQPPPGGGIKAIDPETGKTVWDFRIYQSSLTNGVLSTAGGIVFASIRDGNIVAIDARTGKHLWHYQTGGNNAAAPMSFAVNGRQYVALAAGNNLFSFALPE